MGNLSKASSHPFDLNPSRLPIMNLCSMIHRLNFWVRWRPKIATDCLKSSREQPSDVTIKLIFSALDSNVPFGVPHPDYYPACGVHLRASSRRPRPCPRPHTSTKRVFLRDTCCRLPQVGSSIAKKKNAYETSSFARFYHPILFIFLFPSILSECAPSRHL